MKTLQDIEEKIEEIRNSDFEIGELNCFGNNYKVSYLLRSALICHNAIGLLEDISKEERRELYNGLDDVMKRKLRKLNSSFSEETLNNMIDTYKRGYIIYPMDIFVVDDAVFRKEGVMDDFGYIYKVRTLTFDTMQPYYGVSSIDFTMDADSFSDFSNPKQEQLTVEEKMYTSKFLSDHINAIYKQNITRPRYEMNTGTVHYGYDGLVRGELGGANVYINKRFNDIGRSLKEKCECDLKFCVQSKNDITLYYVHQSFHASGPVWSVVKTNSDVWRLTEEVLKLENNSTNAVFVKRME